MSNRTTVFDNNPRARVPRSSFDLSHEKLMTADFQTLYPVMIKGLIPGDVVRAGVTAVVRFMPLVAPILTGVKMRFFDFFVPFRLLWSDWEEFITKGFSGTVVKTIPVMDPDATAAPTWVVAKGTLWDYFGWPTGVIPPAAACPNDFPRRAYLDIWNKFFRDETLQAELDITDPENYRLLKRNWSKDYFTSALPFQQRGTAPALPVFGNASAAFSIPYAAPPDDNAWATIRIGGTTGMGSGAPNALVSRWTTSTSGPVGEFNTLLTNHNDISGSSFTSVDISDLRLAFKLQEFMEANARGGARYTEFLLQHFNVFNGDARLQRPEYVGGATMPIIISEVLQTAPKPVAGTTTPQGNLAGHGIGVANGSIGSYRATEFGIYMRLMCITADALYQQGINREWLRQTAYDYPFPMFAGLSEQEIFNAEIYVTPQASDPTGAINRDLFGFTGRYNEERFMASNVSGDMRDTFAYWTQSRIFGALPTLDATFISTSPRKDILAAPSEPAFVVRVGNMFEASRPLPFMPVPVSLGGVQ